MEGSLSPSKKRLQRSRSRSVISSNCNVKKHQKESLSPERKRCKRSHSRSIISPHRVKTSERILVTSKEKMQKKSFQIYNKSPRCKNIRRSLSPERKRLQRSHSRSVISRSRSPKILATQSLKNLLIWQLNLHGRIHQSREVGHDLQKILATQV